MARTCKIIGERVKLTEAPKERDMDQSFSVVVLCRRDIIRSIKGYDEDKALELTNNDMAMICKKMAKEVGFRMNLEDMVESVVKRTAPAPIKKPAEKPVKEPKLSLKGQSALI